MPEDQGINGDRWTEEASRLLRRLGWEKIADSNIDIEGSDGYMHGIDALFRYMDGFKVSVTQGVFLEAKRYRTSSFNGAKLRDWVKRFDEKIQELRLSDPFHKKYPAMQQTRPNNGLLVLWFHDLENYWNFVPQFEKALLSVQVSIKRGGSRLGNRLFVLENQGILRLASLFEAVERWNLDARKAEGVDTNLKFYYPSSFAQSSPTQELAVVGLEYIYSKFILARAQQFDGNSVRTADIVFNFGSLDIDSFKRLKQALLLSNMLHRTNDLYIYNYQRDDEFRKIEPDVKTLIKPGATNLYFKPMEVLADLPSWVKE